MNRGRDVLFVLSALLALRFFCLNLKHLVLVLVIVVCVLVWFGFVCHVPPAPNQKPLQHFWKGGDPDM